MYPNIVYSKIKRRQVVAVPIDEMAKTPKADVVSACAL
jgi:hypothetical protein